MALSEHATELAYEAQLAQEDLRLATESRTQEVRDVSLTHACHHIEKVLGILCADPGVRLELPGGGAKPHRAGANAGGARPRE